MGRFSDEVSQLIETRRSADEVAALGVRTEPII
jgi:hypothetical protein